MMIKTNMIEKAEYTADGVLIDKYNYKYDDKLNMIEESEYDAENFRS